MLGFVALTPTYGSLVLTFSPPPDRLPRERAPGRGWPAGRRPSSPSPGRRMAAGPVQACVREVARQGQAILGVRFFRRFLCALKEIGSGASPRQIEAASRESRTKPSPERQHKSTFKDRNPRLGRQNRPKPGTPSPHHPACSTDLNRSLESFRPLPRFSARNSAPAPLRRTHRRFLHADPA
jgi:hypothetical protein